MGLFITDLRKLQKERDFTTLAGFLESRKPMLRYRAFVVLSSMDDLPSEINRRLHEMSGDSDARVRAVAAIKYAGTGGTAISEALNDIMKNGSSEEKINLLQVVSGRVVNDDPELMKVITDGLMDKKETVRIQAIRAAGISGCVHLITDLGELLHAKHHRERLFALEAISKIGGEQSIDYLIGALADNHPEVQQAARFYLKDADNEYVNKALHDASFLQLVKGMNGKKTEREKTAKLIGDEKIREGLPLLHRGCRDRYKGVRIQSLRSIAMFRDKYSVETVARLLDDRFFDVRLEALTALEKIGGENAGKAVERALTDKNSDVRGRAEGILGIDRK